MIWRRLLAAVLACGLSGAAVHLVDSAPDAGASLRIPDTSHDVEIEWRQVGRDLSDYSAPDSDDLARRQKQLQALLAFAGGLSVDVPFQIAGRPFAPGRYRMAFTVGDSGNLRWFLVDGQQAVPLVFEAIEPGYATEHMSMGLHYVTRGEVHLIWHLGERGGQAILRLGQAKARKK